MTDQTKCPHCGAEASCSVLGHTYYGCGSFSHSSGCVQSSHCELTELRAKVAAQQELLKEAAAALRRIVSCANAVEFSVQDVWMVVEHAKAAADTLEKLNDAT